MAAPSISGFEDFSGSPATLTAPSWPGVLTGSTLTTASGNFRMQTSIAASTTYGGRHVLPSARNVTGKYLTFAISFSTTTAIPFAQDFTSYTGESAIMLALFDGSGNRARWSLASPSNSILISALITRGDTAVLNCCIDPSDTSRAQATSGTLDLTNITAFEIHCRTRSSAPISTAPQARCGVIKMVPSSGLVWAGGELADPFDLPYAVDASLADLTSRFLNALQRRVVTLNVPLSINADYGLFEASTILLEPRGNDANFENRIPVAGEIHINVPASGTHIYRNTTFSAPDPFAVATTIGAGGSALYDPATFFNAATKSLTTGETYSSGSFNQFDILTIAGAEINRLTFSGGNELIIQSLGALARFTAEDVDLITIALAAGNYSSLILGAPNDQSFDLDGGGGTYTLTGITGGTALNPIVFDAVDAGNYTLILDQAVSAVVADPVTSGTVTLQNRLTITLAITLNTAATPAASVIVIRADGTSAILNYATNNTGAYSYTYDYPAGQTPDLVIRVGQPGFTVAERVVADADGDISFAIELVQKITLDGPQYTAVLSSGVSVVVDTTNLVGPTANDHRIRLDGSFDARILSNELEVLKGTESGLSAWDLFGSDFAVSPTGGQSFSIPTSVTVERLLGATSSTVRGFLARSDGSNPVDETNGPVSFATVEGLAPQAIRDAMALSRSVGLALGSTSLDQTLSDMKGEGFEAINHSLKAIRSRGDSTWATATGFPTLAQLEARTLPSADYFVVGDYTAPPDISGLLTTSTYTASLPANFGTLGINASGHLSRVTLVDTTTANSDMRGTDGVATGNVTVGGYATGQSPADLVTGFATPGNVTDAQTAIINHGNTNWATADVSAILEDTGTTIPGLIAALPAPLDGTATTAAVTTALTNYTVPTLAQVQAAGFTSTRHDALIATEAYSRPMAKQLGLVTGITATHAEAGITVSDGDGSTTITDNGDGSYTVEGV